MAMKSVEKRTLRLSSSCVKGSIIDYGEEQSTIARPSLPRRHSNPRKLLQT